MKNLLRILAFVCGLAASRACDHRSTMGTGSVNALGPPQQTTRVFPEASIERRAL